MLPGTAAAPQVASRLAPGPHARLRAERAIQLGLDGGELAVQRPIPRDGVAADLLIHAVGHAVEVGDVRLETGLAVAHRLALELRGDGFDPGEGVGCGSAGALQP